MSDARTIFQLGYEVSPIIFTGGIAANIPGGMLPIIAITEATSFVLGLLQGNVGTSLDNYFAHYKPLPGGTLTNNQIGQFPFANQSVAANAIISQPLNISLEMACPVRQSGGYLGKQVIFAALQSAIQQHTAAGGTYTVATPAFIYTNLILTGLRDITGSDSKQAQIHWQWDFTKPLVALADATTANNSLMSLIAGGLPISGVPSWSGAISTIGSVVSGAAASVIPAASNLIGVNSGGSSGGTQSIAPISGGSISLDNVA